MSDTILCNISDAVQIVKEERDIWTIDVLLSLGIPEEIIESSNDIDEYIYQLDKFGVEVEYKTSGEVLVYKKAMYRNQDGEEIDWLNPTSDHLIAHWKPPTYIKKVEGNNVFYEIQLNEWSSIM